MFHSTVQSRWTVWIASIALVASVARADAPAPARVVDQLQAELLLVMKESEALGFEGRYERLAPVLERCFDISFMAKKSVGRYWRTASEEERAHLMGTFRRYLISNYAGRFTGYSGQQFETLGDDASS